MLLMYGSMENSARNNLNTTNYLVLSQFVQNTDSILSTMKSSYQNVFFSRNTSALIYNNSDNEKDHMNLLKSVFDEVKSPDPFDTIPNSGMFILFDKLNLSITKQMTLDMNLFIDAYLSLDNEKASKDLFFSDSYSHFLKFNISRDNANPIPVVAYIRPMPISEANPDMVMVSYIAASQLITPFSNILEQLNADIFILDSNKDILVATNNDPKYYEAISSNAADVFINNKRYFNLTIPSQQNDVSYHAIVPYSIVTSQISSYRYTLIIIMIICLFICFLIMSLLLRNNYSPIENILRSANISKDNNNEFEAIKNLISNNIKQVENLEKTIFDQIKQLRNNYLCNLLKQTNNAALDKEQLKSKYQLEFISDDFCVIILSIEDYGILEESSTAEQKKPAALLDIVMTNIFEELANQLYRGYIVNSNGQYVLLLNIDSKKQKNPKDDISYMLNQALNVLNGHFKIKCKCMISNIHSYSSGIHFAFAEAENVLNCSFDEAEKSLYFYDDITKFSIQNGCLSFEDECHLINKIKCGILSDTEDIIDTIFAQSGFPDIYYAKCAAITLINVVLRIYDEAQFEESILSDMILKELLESKTINELTDIVKKSAGQICNLFSNKKINKIGILAKNYILENYANPDLSLSLISDELGFHMAYLSAIFKEQMGEGTSEYIGKVRIDKAINLLETTTKSIEEISQTVGFGSSRTFNRAFKKHTGVTPSEYR